MSVITQFALDLPDLSISNNVFRGEYIIDADVTVEMIVGAAGTHFEIKLYDLPKKEVETLRDKLDKEKSLAVEAKAGYFELGEPFDLILKGLATKIEAKVEENKLVTTLKGLETGTHALIKNEVSAKIAADTGFEDAVKQILAKIDKKAGGSVELGSVQGLDGVKIRERAIDGKAMAALDALAREHDAELIVSDGKVFIGKPIKRPHPPRLIKALTPEPIELVAEQNLAQFEPFEKKVPESFSAFDLRPVKPTVARGFRFLMTGDPRLRPGMQLDASDIEGFGAEYRASTLKHVFTAKGGYVCEGGALRICNQDEECRKRHEASSRPNADDVARAISQRVAAAQRPFIEVGAVKEHVPGEHRTSLYYKPKADPAETQPSVNAEIEQKDDKVFEKKPMISPFAWHKCGLVVPVYPGMKAVVQHNLGLSDDALVGGFIWSNKPALEPPPGKKGDWWLCLPISPPDAGPKNDTKAANDLTAIDGRRVIEARGVRIVIGQSKLGNVGARPAEGGNDELLIEHSEGTTLKIDASGKLTITAPKGFEIEGDVKINGSLAIE